MVARWMDGPRWMESRTLPGEGPDDPVRSGGAAARRAGVGGAQDGGAGIRAARDGSGRPGGAAGRGRRAAVHLGESPLEWLLARGMIDRRQHEAGERLREAWEQAGLSARVTMRWDAAPSGGGRRGAPEPAERHLDAKARFDVAIAAAGPGLADILWRVVCTGEGLAVAERGLGWPARAGKLVLGMALSRLADHYRLP